MKKHRKESEISAKEKLILAGIDEIRANGVKDFSLRRVAKRCSLSSAAPYKHFESKQDFIIAIIEYINKQWYDLQAEVVEKYMGNTRRQLMHMSLAYISFLVENPHFRSILMLRDEGLTTEQIKLKSELSDCGKRLISDYCAEVGMPEDKRIIKTFIVRSLIYGAALMIDNGELEHSESILNAIANTIDREFDLE